MLEFKKVTKEQHFLALCNPGSCNPDVPCDPSDRCTPTNDDPCLPELGNGPDLPCSPDDPCLPEDEEICLPSL